MVLHDKIVILTENYKITFIVVAIIFHIEWLKTDLYANRCILAMAFQLQISVTTIKINAFIQTQN